MQVVGEIFEEVVVEDYGYSPEQGGIQVGFLQYAVHVGAVSVQFMGQPGHAAPLAGQFLTDEVADVYHSSEYEKSGTIRDLSSSEVPPSNPVYG